MCLQNARWLHAVGADLRADNLPRGLQVAAQSQPDAAAGQHAPPLQPQPLPHPGSSMPVQQHQGPKEGLLQTVAWQQKLFSPEHVVQLRQREPTSSLEKQYKEQLQLNPSEQGHAIFTYVHGDEYR